MASRGGRISLGSAPHMYAYGHHLPCDNNTAPEAARNNVINYCTAHNG